MRKKGRETKREEGGANWSGAVTLRKMNKDGKNHSHRTAMALSCIKSKKEKAASGRSGAITESILCKRPITKSPARKGR